MKTLIAITLSVLFTFSAIASPRPNEEGKQSKTFTVTKGGTLEMSVSGGDIRLTTWEKDEVAIVVEGIDEEDLEDLKMTQSGNTIRIDFRPRWNQYSGDVVFRVSIPSQFDADVRTSGGDVELTGTMKGKLTGATSGGDMRAANIDGPTYLKTSGGDIRLGVVSAEAEVRTSGGDIKVEKVGKSLKASTSGGDVEVGDVGGDATLSTSGGEVKVGKVTGSASLRTAGGDIELKSASGNVEAKTAGGNIQLENITGSIIAKTAGGDVSAELIPSGKGRSELHSSGGNIVLFLPSNAKATIEATIQFRGRWKHRKDDYQIRSDFKDQLGTEDNREGELHATYQLNGGGDLIVLETSEGNIDIRKMSGK